MYDVALLQGRMAALGFSYTSLGLKANVDGKTVKKVVVAGRGNPKSIFRVAKALGFPVKPIGKYGYDLSSIMAADSRKTA